MAEAVVQVLLDNLSSLIQEEIGTIMGVDNEMNKLKSNLTAIQAVLEDAEMKQVESTGNAIRDWLCKLNDLAFEIDDILDECSTQVEKLKHKRGISGRFYCLKNILYKSNLKNILNKREIGRRMKEVTKKLDDVAKERSNFHLSAIVMEKESKFSFTRETGSLLNEHDHVFGRDEEKEKIVDILVNQVKDFQQLSVLPIVGMGGLGKTTLAQLVYNDSRVTQHFDTKLWVCVSENFDLKTLIKAMLASATRSGDASNLQDLDPLQQLLWELLNKKRYLIVLDDVWNEDSGKWSALKSVLACGSSGASIVLTTRLKRVADIVLDDIEPIVDAHYLTELSNENCWKLFKRCALVQEGELSTNLVAIGKQIVEKCAGVPLAAKTLGSLLRRKREENEWLKIRESKIWNLPQPETSILPALRLSYHHLPLNLRKCFAYCAVFPKDSKMDKEELILQWMAHGYISSYQNLEEEDVGSDIWEELVSRSLFQDVEIQEVSDHYAEQSRQSFRRTTFRMHDLVHDLAQSILEIKIPGAQVDSNTKSTYNNKIRQVNLRTRSIAFPTRSLTDIDDLSSIMKIFTHLRSLDAREKKIVDLPSEIGNLNHLRYLNLSYNQIHTLPNTMCNLWNLKILNLNNCWHLVRLPKDMRKMHNLRHVYLEGCRSLIEMPSKIGELTSLKTLTKFIVSDGRGNQLDELQSLNLGGRLVIKHLERVKSHKDAEKANLLEKQSLRILILEWETDIPSKLGENEDDKILDVLEPYSKLEMLRICGFKGRNFPPWMGNSTLENIVRIVIKECPNILQFPQGLGELPHLEELDLQHIATMEYIIEDEAAAASVDNNNDNYSMKQIFPSLKILLLYDLSNLKGLLKEETREVQYMFPKLHSINTERCPSLILPPLPCLKSLRLQSWDSLVFKSISKLENNFTLYLGIFAPSYPSAGADKKGKGLEIWGTVDLCLTEEERRGVLKSFAYIDINMNGTLRCLPEEWLPHLTALESLTIWNCPEFMEIIPLLQLQEGIDDQYLHNLSQISFTYLNKMIRLPEALRFIPSLKSLSLSFLDQLASLPDWLANLTNLLSLFISNCRNLVSLPDCIQEMQSVQHLQIFSCQELQRRCEKEKGEDWHKIKHIPRLQIGRS